MAVRVNEIFCSIQGESLYAGLACVFVRLSGCNLRCTYCDTRYAYHNGESLQVKDIVGRVADYGCRLVEITGGEPLIQDETPALVKALASEGYTVLLETNGSMDITRINRNCIKIMDIKCPSSNEQDKMFLKNLEHLEPGDQIKFVMADENDYAYAKNTLLKVPEKIPMQHILFSPVHEQLPPERLASWILRDHLDVRLHLQLHKIIWPGIDKGV